MLDILFSFIVLARKDVDFCYVGKSLASQRFKFSLHNPLMSRLASLLSRDNACQQTLKARSSRVCCRHSILPVGLLALSHLFQKFYALIARGGRLFLFLCAGWVIRVCAYDFWE